MTFLRQGALTVQHVFSVENAAFKVHFYLIVECCCCFLLIIKPDIRKIFSAGLLQKFCDVCFCFACMPSNA